MNIAVVADEEIIRQQIRGFIKKQEPDFIISDFAAGEAGAALTDRGAAESRIMDNNGGRFRNGNK